MTRSTHCWRRTRRRGRSHDRRVGPCTRSRRRGAVRGLSALPVPRQLAKEPVALAVRSAGPAGRRGHRHRCAERDIGGGRFEQVDELTTGSTSWLSWDEAVEGEIPIDRFHVTSLPRTLAISVPSATAFEG